MEEEADEEAEEEEEEDEVKVQVISLMIMRGAEEASKTLLSLSYSDFLSLTIF